MKYFTMPSEDSEAYTTSQICELLKIAEAQGFPLHSESYVEKMTIKQLDRVLRREYDA